MKSLHATYLFLSLLVLSAFSPLGGEEAAELKKQLCKGWKYEKCRIMGTEYMPKPAEENDRFRFFEDMTFEMVEEGSKKKGTWTIVDASQQLISLSFEEGVGRKLKVEKINESELVYALLADWEYSVTVYMQATPQLEKGALSNSFHFLGGKDGGISLHSLLFGN